MEVVARRGRRRRRRRGKEERDDADPFLSAWDKKGQEEAMGLQGRVCVSVRK